MGIESGDLLRRVGGMRGIVDWMVRARGHLPVRMTLDEWLWACRCWCRRLDGRTYRGGCVGAELIVRIFWLRAA
jgi:hypothetical protein